MWLNLKTQATVCITLRRLTASRPNNHQGCLLNENTAEAQVGLFSASLLVTGRWYCSFHSLSSAVNIDGWIHCWEHENSRWKITFTGSRQLNEFTEVTGFSLVTAQGWCFCIYTVTITVLWPKSKTERRCKNRNIKDYWRTMEKAGGLDD